jgi:hypothetical protein
MPSRIRELVEQTSFIDTHEHLIEESERLSGQAGSPLFPCDDWAYLFMHYLGDDLAVSGMPLADHQRFFDPQTSSEEKYRLIAPYWKRARHTGYGQAVRHTLQGLYGIDDLTERTVERLAEAYASTVRLGFYRHILRDLANVEVCQVNSLQRIFMKSEQPDLLAQDLSIVALSSGLDLSTVEADSGKTAKSLDEWLQIVDWYFDQYGPLAVAVKSQSAYSRRLNYDRVPKERVEPLFARLAMGESLDPEEMKSLQDFLFRYCVERATERGLPVKLHTGYYAGHDYMPLERVRQNAGDLCSLLSNFPDTRFVLMHIGYPYQEEFIALAKHYRNAYIDMCWAWIINPQAGVRFLKDFLVTAPVNKIFTFGGDYLTVETIYGHSCVARQGISQAIIELVEEGWIRQEETSPIIESIMRANAEAVFPAHNRPNR